MCLKLILMLAYSILNMLEQIALKMTLVSLVIGRNIFKNK